MALIERYRLWFEYERDCSAKMIGMLESVPVDRRTDPRFVRSVCLAAHLAACRRNWLILMRGAADRLDPWWLDDAKLESLCPQFDEAEQAWSGYLAGLSDAGLEADFDFTEEGRTYRWSVEGQIVQLIGHAHYHRGQIALIVDALGGDAVDTDYVDWAIPRSARYGLVSE